MPTPSLKAPFMTPARGWLFVVVLSVFLIAQSVICGMRARRLLDELNTCVRKLPPEPAIELHPHVGRQPGMPLPGASNPVSPGNAPPNQKPEARSQKAAQGSSGGDGDEP